MARTAAHVQISQISTFERATSFWMWETAHSDLVGDPLRTMCAHRRLPHAVCLSGYGVRATHPVRGPTRTTKCPWPKTLRCPPSVC